ncbi:MAG: hypothetical protein AMJ78_02355 [Omnitrophica WOR_2 bacterium SM23_29]|nr:MAG: hypothetical protein AMJ78_02355 [Omnitrophica WOR_2 bacterium SM23_29]
MQKYFIPILIISTLLISCKPFAHADTIILKNEVKIDGFIVAEEPEYYIVEIPIGKIRIKKENVREIIRLSPEENYLNFGNQYLTTQNYDAALEQFKKALKIKPDFQQAKDAIARIEKIKKEAEEKRLAELKKKEEEFLEKKEKLTSGFGLELEIVNGQLSVSKIEPDSPAEAAGLKNLDKIIQIDEQATEDKSLEEILNRLLRQDTASYKFTFQREVNLIRKRIVYQKQPIIGVGVFLDTGPNGLVITSVLPDEPADLEGLRENDIVVAIDDNPTKGISLDQASDLIAGNELTNIKFTIQRDIELKRR